jgi:hypothetical protein
MDMSPKAVTDRARRAKGQRDRRKRIPEVVRASENARRSDPAERARRCKQANARYAANPERAKEGARRRRKRIRAEIKEIRSGITTARYEIANAVEGSELRLIELTKEEFRLLALLEGAQTPERRAEGAKARRTRRRVAPLRMMVARALMRQRGKNDGIVKQRANDKTAINVLVDELSPPPTHCPIFGVELEYAGEKGLNRPNMASIDKIIPALGYVVGNVAIISRRANTIKNDASLEDLEALASWLRRRLNNG